MNRAPMHRGELHHTIKNNYIMMKIIRVTDRKTRKKFLDAARVIYKNDKIWVCPFDNEIEAIFDPKKIPIINMVRQNAGYWKTMITI